jgi:hypothetical protein
MSDNVPRILHQIFLQGESAIPDRIQPIIEKLRAANPGWAYTLWDAEKAEAWIAATYGDKVLHLYLRIPPEYYAARSDLLRYLILYAMGGVYLDVKSTCDIPLDQAIRPGEKYLLMPWDPDSREHHPELSHVATGEYVQWALASVPGHPLMRAVLRHVFYNIADYSQLRDGIGKFGTLRVTGPIAYTIAIEAARPAFSCTMLDSSSERGFRYSALPHRDAHIELYTEHYWKLKGPVVTPSSLEAATLSAARRIKRFPPGAALVRWVRSIVVPKTTR